jgi:thiol-disulfide isomerase/thioredoxin
MSVTAYHFWSPTCGPCKVIKPAIDDLKEEFPQVVWLSVNLHDDKEVLSQKYKVAVVPTIVVESKDRMGNVVLLDKHSGTNVAGYYRILRSGLRTTQQS